MVNLITLIISLFPKTCAHFFTKKPCFQESRLLALFNSQSKENHPSESVKHTRSSKPVSSSESQKRKAIPEPESDLSLPRAPIKLKLSLKSKSSDSDKYKVVKHTDVNNSDSSNGWKSTKAEWGTGIFLTN